MIQQAFSGMMRIMMAKFMLNDVPHALGIATSVQDREQIASSHWKEILKYCHTVDDLRRIVSGQGVIKLYHGAPTEYAEIMIREGPKVPYKVEDTARYVANLYGISWRAFYRWAYRRHEVREKLSTSTAPVAVRWAWSFPLGEVLTDLNAHARMYVAFKALAVREGISLDDAYERLDKEAIEIARATGQRYNTEAAPGLLGLPDKLAPKSKSGALVEIVVNAKVISDLGSHDARSYLEDVESGELPLEEALLFWNHGYRDFRIAPDDIISMRIVVRNLQPWEQNMIEDMIKEKRLSPYCGVPNPGPVKLDFHSVGYLKDSATGKGTSWHREYQDIESVIGDAQRTLNMIPEYEKIISSSTLAQTEVVVTREEVVVRGWDKTGYIPYNPEIWKGRQV